MILEAIHCPDCDGIEVIKHGTTPDGKQRYFCQSSECRSAHLYYAVQPCGLFAQSQATNQRYGDEWEWHPRYCSCASH